MKHDENIHRPGSGQDPLKAILGRVVVDSPLSRLGSRFAILDRPHIERWGHGAFLFTLCALAALLRRSHRKTLGLTAPELADSTGLGVDTVRRHLRAFEAEGLASLNADGVWLPTMRVKSGGDRSLRQGGLAQRGHSRLAADTVIELQVEERDGRCGAHDPDVHQQGRCRASSVQYQLAIRWRRSWLGCPEPLGLAQVRQPLKAAGNGRGARHARPMARASRKIAETMGRSARTCNVPKTLRRVRVKKDVTKGLGTLGRSISSTPWNVLKTPQERGYRSTPLHGVS